MQESIVHEDDVVTYLNRVSICVLPIAVALCIGLERKDIASYTWNTRSICYFLAYAILLAFFYSFLPVLIQFSNAAEMNISILTSNFYSLAISLLAFHLKFTWLYFIGFLCIPTAIVIFSLFPRKEDNDLETSPLADSEPQQNEYTD